MAAPTGRDCSRVLSVLSGKRQVFTVRPADMPPRRPTLNALRFPVLALASFLSDLAVALSLATDLAFVAILPGFVKLVPLSRISSARGP
jgi:hypothetical protein